MDLKQELIDRLGVPENWDKYDYQTQRYSFDDMQEVLEDIVKKLTLTFDISELIENGEILNELDFERALIADRKLRVLAKENPKLKSVRKKLRDLIEAYENKNWNTDKYN